MYVINLFGDGIRYWICDTSSPKWRPLLQFKEENSLEWNEMLFDLSLLERFGFDYWSSLATEPECFGFLLSAKNRIELKKGGRFLDKFKSNELYNDTTLFPQFQTEIRKTRLRNSEIAVIMQFETGLIGKYKIDSKTLLIDDIKFILEQVIPNEKDLLFTGLKFCGTELLTAKQDTVVRGMKCIMM